jgi:hypothetical protein
MKHNGIFPGIILIGLGIYFLSASWTIPYLDVIHRWPTLFIIFGIAFILQAKATNDSSHYFPGVILIGLGFHFHALHFIDHWPNQWEVYTLLIGIAFLSQTSRKKKDGFFLGSLFVFFSILGLFSTGFVSWVAKLFNIFESFWPIAIILIGLYLLLKKK